MACLNVTAKQVVYATPKHIIPFHPNGTDGDGHLTYECDIEKAMTDMFTAGGDESATAGSGVLRSGLSVAMVCGGRLLQFLG